MSSTSTTDSTGGAAIRAFIQETFETSVNNWVTASSITLLLYALILNISQEIEYIWLKSFSFPTFLYLLTRYTPLLDQGLVLVGSCLPPSIPNWLFNVISYTADCMQVLGYIGVQGLLVIRAYSLCHRNTIISVALIFGFLAGIVIRLIGSILLNDSADSNEYSLLTLLSNIVNIFTEFLVFGVCFFNIWDTWRLQRTVHLRRNVGLASTLLRQVLSRFFLTVSLSSAITVLETSIDNIPLWDSVGSIQESLSSILLLEFTLELRRRNSAVIAEHNISLPTIRSVPDILQHVHQSIVVEMGDLGGINAGDITPGILPSDSAGQLSDSPHPESESVHISV